MSMWAEQNTAGNVGSRGLGDSDFFCTTKEGGEVMLQRCFLGNSKTNFPPTPSSSSARHVVKCSIVAGSGAEGEVGEGEGEGRPGGEQQEREGKGTEGTGRGKKMPFTPTPMPAPNTPKPCVA